MSDLAILKDKIQKVITGTFSNIGLIGENSFRIPFDKLAVDIEVFSFEDPETRGWREERGLPLTEVVAKSWALRKVPESPDFYRFLVREVAMETGVQVFAIDDQGHEGHIVIGTYHRIGGDTLDPNELIDAVMNVCWDTQKIGDMVLEKFDGVWNWTNEK